MDRLPRRRLPLPLRQRRQPASLHPSRKLPRRTGRLRLLLHPGRRRQASHEQAADFRR